MSFGESPAMASSHPDHFSMTQRGWETYRPQPQVIIPSAAYGGAIISFVLCPYELVKCRIQVQGAIVPSSSWYSGPLDCALKTMKDEGVTGLFCGGFAQFFERIYRECVFFTAYENVLHYMYLSLNADTQASRNNYLADADMGIARGGLGSIAFWSAVLPLDVVKTIIQTSLSRNSMRNPFLVLYSSWAYGMLHGSRSNHGVFPANVATIVTWELFMKVLGVAH